ncbi:MAG TPA: hypothetical protein PLB25_03065 [Rhodoferax sp.]|nr:hypothetical protein [Rhodoferax sp.]
MLPNTLKIGPFGAKPKSPDEIAALNLDNAARNLPDECFANDPAVIVAAADVVAWRNRLDRLASYPSKRNAILILISDIEAELAQAKEACRLACLDSFLADDHDFIGALAVQERVALLENRLQAARTAKIDIERSYSEMTQLHALADKAEANLHNTRFALKRQSLSDNAPKETRHGN